jgi:PAS domain S-box-containing protein
MKTRNKIVYSLAGAALLVALGVAGMFWFFGRIEEQAEIRKKNLIVVTEANDLMSAMKDAETGQRGYLLTGDEAFLEPYLAVRDNLAGRLKRLRQMSLIAAAHPHLDALAPLIDAKLAELAQGIALRRSQDIAGAQLMVRSGQGKRLMDAIRDEMGDFAVIEDRALAQRDATINVDLRRLFSVIMTVSLLVVLSAGLIVYLIHQKNQQRIKNLVHLETERLLEIQEQMNQRLQLANGTLRDSEEKLAVTLNSIGDAVIATDAKACIVILNHVAEKLTGWTRAQAIGRPLADVFTIVNKETRQPGMLPTVATLANGTTQGLANHTVLIAKDGSESDIADSCAPICDRDGQVIGAVLVFRDVTHEYATQQALRDLQFYTRSLIESHIDALMTTDAQGIIGDVNQQMVALTGRTRDELIGAPCRNFFTDPVRADQAIKRVLAENTVRDYELTVRARNGEETVVSYNAATFHDRDGKLQGVFAAARDVTQRKRTETQLLESEARTRAILTAAADAIIIIDADGTIESLNTAAMTLFGYPEAEMVGRNVKMLMPEPYKAEHDRYLQNYAGTGIKKIIGNQREVAGLRKNGETFPMDLAVSEVQLGSRRLFTGIVRDITDRKRFERTLQEKNIELEHANRMKSEFLATMSHELRTPLNAIIGFSEALKDGLMGAMSDTQQEYIGDIFTSGQHLLALINDILDLSKVEAGMMGLELEAVDVSSLLSSSLSIVREKAAAQRIELELDTGEDLGIPQLDMRKTKQIVYNLLSNAVKFSPDGARVTLRARRVGRAAVGALPGPWPVHGFPLAGNEYNEFLEICVSDSGIGISQDNMKKLFQAFSQIDSSLARKFEGTGLGLAMVKQLAELHGGTVAVASAEGEGARFAAWLPLRTAAQAACVPVPGAAPPDGAEPGPRVALVVDDDDLSADLVRLLLEAEGFSVVRAASAETALLVAPQQTLSLITLDIELPGMDGWEFLLQIRDNPSLARVPVVIAAGQLYANLALAGGAAAVLQKPISRAQLKATLANLGLHPAPERTYTLLVVDDDPKAVEVIAAFLPAPGYAVVRAYGGAEAITLAQRLRPDLILLDLMMPQVSGFDVVQALLRHGDTARIPILVVTAKHVTAQDRSALNTSQGKVIHIVEKSGFNQTRFIAEVRRALLPR